MLFSDYALNKMATKSTILTISDNQEELNFKNLQTHFDCSRFIIINYSTVRVF
jgi:hypothetical protein